MDTFIGLTLYGVSIGLACVFGAAVGAWLAITPEQRRQIFEVINQGTPLEVPEYRLNAFFSAQA